MRGGCFIPSAAKQGNPAVEYWAFAEKVLQSAVRMKEIKERLSSESCTETSCSGGQNARPQARVRTDVSENLLGGGWCRGDQCSFYADIGTRMTVRTILTKATSAGDVAAGIECPFFLVNIEPFDNRKEQRLQVVLNQSGIVDIAANPAEFWKEICKAAQSWDLGQAIFQALSRPLVAAWGCS